MITPGIIRAVGQERRSVPDGASRALRSLGWGFSSSQVEWTQGAGVETLETTRFALEWGKLLKPDHIF